MRRFTKTAFSRLLLIVGLGGLLLGALVYVLTRTQLPLLLLPLDLARPILRGGGPWTTSLPSALHALSFTALLGAATGSSKRSVAIAGLFLVSLNVVWEVSCHPFFGFVHAVSQSLANALDARWGYIACTFDVADIVAASLGALIPSVLYGLIGPSCNLPPNDSRRSKQNA